jgi:hypothetical protein
MNGRGANERQVQRWLDRLRDGSEADKIGARRGLARVFEQRGMLEEAIELLERNLDAGVRSAETLRWLSRLYQARGDEVTSLETAIQASAVDLPEMAEVGRQPTRPQAPSQVPRVPVPYLLMVVGMGITLGVGLWVLLPLLRP